MYQLLLTALPFRGNMHAKSVGHNFEQSLVCWHELLANSRRPTAMDKSSCA